MLLTIKQPSYNKTIIWVSIFAISMALLESAVVVYLRALLYTHDFGAPFPPMDTHIFVTELFRELATLIMLISIGFLAGRTAIERFAYFLLSFALWDIFYYVFLRLIIHWPASLTDWDILFLLPVPWTGPVITPVIIAINMIMLALLMLKAKTYYQSPRLKWKHSIYLITGCILVLITFTYEHLGFLGTPWSTDNNGLLNINFSGFPSQYPWVIFFTGEVIILIGILMYAKDYRLLNRKNY